MELGTAARKGVVPHHVSPGNGFIGYSDFSNQRIMRESLMKWLARLVYRHDLSVIVGALLLTVVFIGGVLRLSMVSNVAYMLPRHNLVVSDYLTSLERMGTLDYLVILLSAPRRDAVTGFADRFAEKMNGTGLISEVSYTISDSDKDYILSTYLPNIFLYLDDDEFGEVAGKLEPAAIDEAVRIDKGLLLVPISSGSADFVIKDPLGLLSVVQGRVSPTAGGFRIDAASGYYLSVDGSHLLMLARPVGPPQDISFDEKLFSNLSAFERDIKQDKDYEDVLVEYTGGYPIAVSDASTIKRDLIITMTSSIIAVLFLFYLVFRRLTFLFVVAPSLGLGIFWTLGFAGFALGHLNMVTAAFGAILAGLGIDFSIHFYNRFIEEMSKRKGLEDALVETYATTGVAVITGALTTAVAFFAMGFTQFSGLSELGIIGGVGILMTLLSTFTVLPALIVRTMKVRGAQIVAAPLPAFGIERFGKYIVKRRRFIIAAVLIVTIGLGYSATRVHFETDINKLRPKESPALRVQDKIMEVFSGSAPELIITTEGKNLEEAIVVSEEAADIMRGYPEITAVDGPGAFLPSVKKQRKNIIRAESLDIRGAVISLEKSLVAHGFDVAPFMPFMDSISRFADGTVQPITYRDIAGTPGQKMIERYILHKGDSWYVSIFAYPRAGGPWEHDIDRSVVDRLKRLSGSITVASITMVIAEMKKIITRDFIFATILASIGVLLALGAQFREIRGVVLCGLSLLVGIVWTVGFMGLMGISMNFANIVVIPMIIGIGIDNNIHIYQRYKESENGGIVPAMKFSGRAVIMCGLTTIVGFGSLTFSKYGGLSAIGILSVMGVALCLVSALVVLPTLLALMEDTKVDGTRRS
jgi:predicted RND superfamily exporter protein